MDANKRAEPAPSGAALAAGTFLAFANPSNSNTASRIGSTGSESPCPNQFNGA